MDREQEQREYNAIIHGVIWKELILFSLPLILGTFFQQLYNTVDAVVVGRFVGKQALSAVGGTSAIIVNVFVGFFVGISSGASVIVAQYYGAGNTRDVSRAVHTAIALSVISGAVLCVLGFFLTPVFSVWMGTPQDILSDTVLYLRIYFLGMTANLIYNMGAGILRAVGDSRRPLIFLVVSCLANIVLDLLFVLIFHMGVAGAAIATVLCQVISAVMVIYALAGTKESYQLKLRNIRISSISLKRIIAIGLPAGIQSLMYTLSNVFIQASINSFGTDSVAAWTAYGKIDSLFWMFCNSSGVAVTTFVGQNYGAGLYKRVRECVRQSVILVCSVTLLITILFYRFGAELYVLFTTDDAVIRTGTEMMRYLVPFYMTYIGIEIFSGTLRGMGDAFVPMLIDVLGICVVRVSWILIMVPRYHTLRTVMASYPITWILTSGLFLIYYFFYIRKHHIGFES